MKWAGSSAYEHASPEDVVVTAIIISYLIRLYVFPRVTRVNVIRFFPPLPIRSMHSGGTVIKKKKII